ncbi:universal stress protein [Streptomyces sp. NPDC006879]|uniref:universal stress protein n=1 Tax=Streptomyces sp. NPDC006879 TaxID=3364767 RepID=UPI0036788B07
MTRAIAVGVDGSPESTAAADWAAAEAVHRGLPVKLLHAWGWEPMDLPLVQDPAGEAARADVLVKAVETDLRRRYPQISLSVEVVSGTPVPSLLAAARDAELTVIGTRGHGALAGSLLGSTGQQVVAAAERPIVSVRTPAPGNELPTSRGGEIVVGQQGGVEESAEVLGFAFQAAAARGAGVRAVRAWNLPPIYAYSPGSLRLVDEAGGLEPFERKALQQALAPWRDRFPEVPVAEHVEIGSAGQVLLSAAAGADLLVVGRRARRSPIGTRVGSAAHAVLHHALCPVAVVPHP